MIGHARIVLGALLLAVPPAAWFLGQPAPDAGEVPIPSVSSPSVVGTAPPAAAPPKERPSVATRSALLSAATTTVAARPAGIRLPSIGVDALVVPVGVESDGQLEIPVRVAEVGWYEHGPVPGDPGSAVLAGHVDSRTQGRGAFFDLRRVGPGDQIEISDADGLLLRFRVDARRTYAKDELPVEDLFDRQGEPRLVLITCGGDFDDRTRHYEENVVVFATLSR